MKKAETATKSSTKSAGFSAEEKAAAKERAKELKAEARLATDKEAGEKDLLAKIAEMPEPDRSMATRIHALVKAAAPDLMPRTWYGQPAYATKDGKIVCFFQNSQKFGIRYATFGFNEEAHLDDGEMWPVAYALKALTPAAEATISALVKKAVS
jgi:hypothetical protein